MARYPSLLSLALAIDVGALVLFVERGAADPRVWLGIAVLCALGNLTARVALSAWIECAPALETAARVAGQRGRSRFTLSTALAIAAVPGVGELAWWTFALLLAAAAFQCAAWISLPRMWPTRTAHPGLVTLAIVAVLLVIPALPCILAGEAPTRPTTPGVYGAVLAVAAIVLHGVLRRHARIATGTHQPRAVVQLAEIVDWGALGLVALVPLAHAPAAVTVPALATMCVVGAAASIVAVWHLQVLHHRAAAAVACTPAIALLAAVASPLTEPLFAFVLIGLPIIAAVTWASIARRDPLKHPLLDTALIAAGVAITALHVPGIATPAEAAAHVADRSAWIATVAVRALYLGALAVRIRTAPTRSVPVARLRR